MGLKDISLALSLGAEFNMPLKLGNVSKDYYSLAAASERSNQDCTAILHLIEDIAEIDN